MSIYLRVAMFGTVCLGFICLCAPTSKAQVARTELHAIPTLTLSDRDFLTGEKNGTSVTIAGSLRIPSLGTDRLPAVILVHGSGGVGGNVDRWSQELNGIGLATFTIDSFTARGLQSTSANQALLGRLNMILRFLPRPGRALHASTHRSRENRPHGVLARGTGDPLRKSQSLPAHVWP